MHKIVLWFSLLMTTLPLFAALPESLPLAVTYYDFHSDGSCNDFNPIDDRDPVTPNMVADTLDGGQLKQGSRVYFSHYIERWFTPYEDHIERAIVPSYYYDDYNYERHGSLSTMYTVDHDTMYINMVIPDSLTLELLDQEKGIYQFRSSSFFPLDGKGFKKEWTKKWDNSGFAYDHNYSFTMRLDREFTYRSGRDWYFSIEGDDDIWVYVNGRKVIDLGGIHGTAKDSIALDDIALKAGLVDAEVYTLSLFFAERQATGSNLNITWNFALTNSAPKVKSALADVVLKEDATDSIIADCDTLFSDETALQFTLFSSDSSLFIPLLDSEQNCVIQTKKDQFGEATLIIEAIDNEGLSAFDTVKVTLESVNDTPITIAPLDDIVLQEDFADTLITAVEPLFSDDGALSYSVISSDSSLCVPRITDEKGLVFSSVADAHGVLTVYLTATDDGALFCTDTILVTVNSVNDKPTLTTLMEDVTLAEDAADTLLHLLTDHFADDDQLTFALTLDDSSLIRLSQTPEQKILAQSIADAFGTLSVIVTATDGSGLSIKDTFSIMINSVNDAPVVVSALPDIGLPENCEDTLVADLQTVFSDDDLLSFSVECSDSLLIVPFINSHDSLGLYLHNNVFGLCSLWVTATDTAGLSVVDTFKVTVVEGNNPPILVKAIENCLLSEDAPTLSWATLSEHFSDESTLKYTVSSSDSTVVIPALLEGKTVTVTPVPDAFGVAEIVVNAVDEYSLAVSDTFTVTVTSVNDNPTLLTPIADIILAEDASLYSTASLDTYFSDDDQMTYGVTSSNSVVSVTVNDVNKLEILCAPNAHGAASLIVTAVDTGGLLVADTLVVTVTSVNDAPVRIGSLSDRTFSAKLKTVPLGTMDTLFSDDGPLLYEVSSSDSSVGVGSVHEGLLSLEIKSEQSSSADLYVTARDTEGLSASDTLRITLNKEVVSPIVVAPIGNVLLLKNSAAVKVANLSTVFTSSETLQYNATVTPEEIIQVTISEQQDCIITPKTDAVGLATVVVSATDPLQQSVTDTFTVTLYKENSTPILLHQLPDLVLAEGQPDTTVADLDTLFSDDGPLTYTVISSDSTLLVGVVNLEKELILNLMPEKAGRAELIICATDDSGLSVSDTLAVTVQSGNKLPIVVNPVADMVVLKNSKDTTVAVLADVFSDDGPLTYRVSSGDVALVICNLDIDGRLTLSFVPESVGETDIILTAMDSYGAVASDIFKVKVNIKNEVPLLVTPFSDMLLAEDAPDTVVGDLSTIFADETALSYQVTLTDSLLLTATLDAKSVLKLQCHPDAYGKSSVLVRATDIEGLWIEDTFVVTVTSVNDAPQLLSPLEDVIMNEDEMTVAVQSLVSSFVDDDILQFSCVSLRPSLIVAEISSESSLLLTPQADAFGAAEVICIATDSYGSSVQDTLLVTVQRDTSEGDGLWDEDLGGVVTNAVLGIAVAPNPVPRECSTIRISVDHADADRVTGVLLTALGDEIIRGDALIGSSVKAELMLNISSQKARIAGQSFLLYLQHFKEGEVVKESHVIIGIRR